MNVAFTMLHEDPTTDYIIVVSILTPSTLVTLKFYVVTLRAKNCTVIEDIHFESTQMK